MVNELADRVAVMYAGRVVEEGMREQVLGAARHPYTEGLLRSIPARARRGEKLAEIEGTVPSPGDWPEGCRFSTRCPRVLQVCHRDEPAVTAISEGHTLRCHAVAREIAP